MQNYLTCAQNQVFLGYISVFSALINFLLIFLFFVCLCCFSLRACFHVLRLLSQMLRLEFHVNQRGSSVFIGPLVLDWQLLLSQSVEEGRWRHLQCASLVADAQCSVHLVQVKNGLLSAGKHISYRTLLYVCCHCCTPAGDPLTLNE